MGYWVFVIFYKRLRRAHRRDVIRDSARQEFDAARFETDPAIVRSLWSQQCMHPVIQRLRYRYLVVQIGNYN